MRKGKTIIIAVVLIISILVFGLFLFRDKLIARLLYSGPREPKNQTETTYNIGWWSHQDGLNVENLEIEIIDSQLNLFNNKSLVSYTISGTITGDKNWEPYLKKVHVSEKFIKTDSVSKVGLIELTPVIGVKENDTYTGSKILFKVTNELLMESFHWGNNPILFKCGQLEKQVELKQRK